MKSLVPEHPNSQFSSLGNVAGIWTIPSARISSSHEARNRSARRLVFIFSSRASLETPRCWLGKCHGLRGERDFGHRVADRLHCRMKYLTYTQPLSCVPRAFREQKTPLMSCDFPRQAEQRLVHFRRPNTRTIPVAWDFSRVPFLRRWLWKFKQRRLVRYRSRSVYIPKRS